MGQNTHGQFSPFLGWLVTGAHKEKNRGFLFIVRTTVMVIAL